MILSLGVNSNSTTLPALLHAFCLFTQSLPRSCRSRCLYYNRTGNSAFCNKTTTRYVLMSAFRESRSDKRSGTVYRPDPRSHFSPISPISRLSSRRGRLFLGFLFSSCIGLLAYRRRSLTRDGAAGAVVTGTTIFGLGGWPWGLSLIYFFLSSTLLS